MDALFFFRHSAHHDVELRFALRGIAENMPWIRKVWIFGDKPRFISSRSSRIEHVSHESLAETWGYKTPVTNFFLMYFLSSLIPELAEEFLWFCDDFIVINPLSQDDAKRDRYINDFSESTRGRGLWKESLWRTHDFLQHLGYTHYNFETHSPTYFTKRRIFEAYCDFKDYVTEDRWYGLLGPSAILNHSTVMGTTDLVKRSTEGMWVGFHGNAPGYRDLKKAVAGKTFLNFDDGGFTADMEKFLTVRFPDRCIFESEDSDENDTESNRECNWYPEPILSSKKEIGGLAARMGLNGMCAELCQHDDLTFSSDFLRLWSGQAYHRVEIGRVEKTLSKADRHQMTESSRQSDGDYLRLEDCAISEAENFSSSGDFADGSLDLVYANLRLSGEETRQFIDSWYPKVRSGGLIGGIGYFDGTIPGIHSSVKSVVDRWATEEQLSVDCTGEHVWRSWLARRPLTP